MKLELPKLPRIDPAQAGIVGVATAAAVLSFSSLRALAISTNTWSWIAWLLPISLDAAAATATFVWLRTDRREIVRLAATIAWSTIVLSVVGNGVHHAFQALNINPWWWVALIVGAVPPAVFGAVVHLAITAAKPVVAIDQPVEQVELIEPGRRTEPVVDVVATVEESVEESVEDDGIDWSLSERRLAAELGISRHAARQLKAARTEVAS